jgi:hypothetical protein
MLRHRLVLACLVVLAEGCASSSVSVIQKASPKPTPCDLATFEAEEKVGRPFEKLCVIAVDEKPVTGSYYDQEADGRARTKIEDAACRCGADAVILRRLGRGNWRATAIRYR